MDSEDPKSMVGN
jgi:hypothetical protein